MKFKDIKTLEHFLLEYGMKPGNPAPVSSQQSGSITNKSSASPTAKGSSSSPSKATSSTPTTKQQSPSTQDDDIDNDFEIVDMPANKAEMGAVVTDKTGKNVQGIVVSPIGKKPKVDAVVIQDPKGEYTVADKDTILKIKTPKAAQASSSPQDKGKGVASTVSNIAKAGTAAAKSSFSKGQSLANKVWNMDLMNSADPTINDESKATKLLSKLKIKSKKVRSIKKILRNSKFNEQREIVFEINFNSLELAKSALNAPISCGFEAETTWPSLDAGGDDDDFLDGMRWSDVADLIYDQEGSRSISAVEQAFNEWLMESDYYWEAQKEVISELVNDRKDDMSYISDYAYQELGADEVEDFKNETLEDLSDEEKAEYEDWGEDEWAKKLVEEKYEDSFEEWLADQIRDNGEDHDDTWERVTNEVDINDWMREEYGDWYSLLRNQDIFLYNPNSSGGVAAVASELEPWAENNSMSSSVEAGDYHSGKSVDNDYWRVEEDSSIEADGAAAEIISPVYDTPQQMMSEMKSLFEFFQKSDVETNSSTGLHVTMSWNGDQTPANKLKMAVLLGDKYLLGLFDRENNTYTRSQLDNVAKGIEDLMKNPSNLKTLSAVEEILGSKVSDSKFSSINFKEATNSSGNNLIEFRIGGGDDYHTKIDSVLKAVIRYSAIMQAGHDPNAFRKDYILALYRLIGKEAATPDPEKIKSMNIAYGDAGKNPMLLALQTSAAKNNVSTVTDYLVRGLELIAKAKQLQSQQAQGELFTPRESVNEDGEDPARYYELAKENILMALAISALDIGTNKSQPPKAAGIAAIRKGVKELGLSTTALWQSMLSNNMVLNQAHELRLDKYEFQHALAAGLSAMLKTNLGVQPEQPKAVVKYSAVDTVYIKDSDYEAVQQGKAEPEMFMIATPAEQETNDAFKAKFGVERWDTTRLNRVDLQRITANTGIKFMQESVFDRFDKLSLEEQLRILERVDGAKLTEAWSKKYKDSINCSDPKGFSQKAHCAGKKKTNEDDMLGRRLFKRGAYKAALDALSKVLARKTEPRKHSVEYYAARIAQSYPGVDARELTKMHNDLVNETSESMHVDENLRKWFKDKWVRFGPDGKIKGDCAREKDSEGKPKCLPQSKAYSLGKKGRASAARRKRREDPNPERKGAAKNVATKKESVVEYTDIPFNICPSCGGDIVHESQLNEKQDACYHKVRSRYKVWPSAYASGALVQCRKKGAKNWGNSKKESVEEDYGRYYCSTDKKWKTRQGPKQKRKVKEGAVPDNSKIKILQKIMSKPLLARDIGAQMEAFFAIPDPTMIRDFRLARAQYGDSTDLREIVKSYTSKLHQSIQRQLKESAIVEYDDLSKEKQVIIKTVSGLDATDKEQAAILDRIYKILNSGQISSNIDVAFSKPLVDENLPEAEKIKVRQDMARIIAGLEQDYGSMKKFLDRLEEKGGVVNIAELSKSLNTFENVFGDEVATAAFITLSNYGVGKKQKGPCEYALACLSNQIKLAEGEGDLQVNGIGKVELKAALSVAGGRIGYGGGSQKAKRAVVDKYAQYIPTVLERLNAGHGGSIGIRPFLDALNVDLPTTNPDNVKIRKALMTELLTMDLEKFAAPVIEKFATSMNFDEIEIEYLKQNYAWYKDRDDFDALLLIHVPNRKTAMIRNDEDLIAFRNSSHSNATSISIVPTQAGAGREQWAQLTLNKSKAG